jgi:hypothetical protein
MKPRIDKYARSGHYGQYGFVHHPVARKPKSYLGAYLVGITLIAVLANIAYYLS